jgi:hypothetical protein
VDEQARDGYRRTIIHLDQHAVLKVLRDFLILNSICKI